MFHPSIPTSRGGLSLAAVAASLLYLLIPRSSGAQAAPVASVTITGTNGVLVRGKSLQLVATVADSAGRPLNDRTVLWSSLTTSA